MKHTILTFLILISGILISQQPSDPVGGKVIFNPDKTPCLVAEDYELYHEIVTENQALLEAQNKRLYGNTRSQITSFVWPVKQATGFDYNSFWSISNYLDHNPATGQLEDWNCGARTYDTSSGYDHQGLDIYTWPFWWKQMDDEQSNVIAAAAGQIVFKNDGSYDRNCSFNSDQWNAVYIEHSDGSIAWYGHMKNGSLTSKGVGDTVAQGEYLGVIGSSGNSTGPHLHFEVYDENNNLIDPYSGPCNDLNSSSWWSDQLDYVNPKINALLTHSAPPQFPSCPATEIPNISDEFPTNSSVIVASYYRDQQAGTSAQYRVYDSSNNLYNNWTFDFTDFYYSSYWYWTINVNGTEGIWRFEVTYNGETVSHEFQVGELSIADQEVIQLAAFPNPAENILQLSAAVPLKEVSIIDITGKNVISNYQIENTYGSIDISSLASGIYFIKAQALDTNNQTTIRVIKR